ncbi:hypothetical protein [Anatilimnocola aggregata]|uniref:hypothetical protein n=1 Tax=Anatilimnocola aggregata TaxID=2528021 RepID=UPI0011AAF1BD|nr:hypothetical protein [Anatilimnocola aggregata]
MNSQRERRDLRESSLGVWNNQAAAYNVGCDSPSLAVLLGFTTHIVITAPHSHLSTKEAPSLN